MNLDHKFDYYIKVNFPFCDDLDNIDFRKMSKVYEKFKHYSNTFPTIGNIESTNYDGYGVSDNNGKLMSELTKLTKEFPKLTFRFYYSYFDFSSLIVFDITDIKIDILNSYCDESIIRDGYSVLINYKNLRINDEASKFITGEKILSPQLLERRKSYSKYNFE